MPTRTTKFKEEDMIVLKAPQEKLLGALQAVAGIVERRHLRQDCISHHSCWMN